MKKDSFKYNGLIDKEIIETLKEAAEKDYRSLSSMVNKVLGDYCKYYDTKGE